MLTESGVVRSDMTTDLATGDVTPGVPVTVRLTITKGQDGPPMAGAAVYLWHCDQEGRYSMYSDGVTERTWLRAVQAADSAGVLEFRTVFPGCYDGRWPHMHFEVYESVDATANVGGQIATSQLAMTEAVSAAVYATAGYERSVGNLASVSLTNDNVFGDGADRETPTFTGDPQTGYVAALTVPIAV